MSAAKTAARGIIDSLVHTDTVALVSFSSTARRENNYLVQATRTYRSSLKVAVDRLEPDGGTNYNDALRKAFATVRHLGRAPTPRCTAAAELQATLSDETHKAQRVSQRPQWVSFRSWCIHLGLVLTGGWLHAFRA
jgi:hypothetical protein